ncbi:MAG TPA: nucleotide sugar dehydrogenase [Anaerolineae bacterium]|nr:nucleotide sugar dehydrogenase [Anaerolineae bacterium]
MDNTVAIIGLGYVGLPLAVAFGHGGVPVIGVESSAAKVADLKAGRSYIPDVPTADIAALVQAGLLRPTTDYDEVRAADSIFICVPTPYDAAKAPDLSFIISAAEGIAPRLRAGQLVVLQSTTYPGTTDEVVLPILERTGLKAAVDFDLAFSPERIDPGNTKFNAINTPKVVGGTSERATQRAADLLRRIGAPVEIVSSARAAEMTKLLENIFRSVNIALVNELALLCERMGLDVWEVIRAASTKPFGFMPFYPGPGVGGHCIPIDPLYLSWKAREYDFHTNFIDLAAEVNESMPYHVIDLVAQGLSGRGRGLQGSQVLVLGVAFKRDIDDPRNSPAERVIELLMRRGARVSYHDAYVPRFAIGPDVFQRERQVLESVALTETALHQADCVLIVTGHSQVDYARVVAHAPLVVDSCNVTASLTTGQDKIVRLGAPADR